MGEYTFDEQGYRRNAFIYSFLFNKVFRQVHVSGIEIPKTLKGEGASIVYCSNHKSHADYILLGHALYLNGLQPIRYAAGENLSHGIKGKYFEKMGAFFVPRNGKHSALKMLLKSLDGIFSNGEHILLFPEGGRSYTGELKPLKPGILNVITRHSRDLDTPIYVVPVGITYETVPEEHLFEYFVSGSFKDKKELWKHDVRALIKYLGKGLLFGCGNVYVNFGKPVLASSLNGNVDSVLGQKIGKCIGVLPQNVVSYSISRDGYSKISGIENLVDYNLNVLRDGGANLIPITEHSPNKPAYKGLHDLKTKGIIKAGRNDSIVILDEYRRNYLGNGIYHHFKN